MGSDQQVSEALRKYDTFLQDLDHVWDLMLKDETVREAWQQRFPSPPSATSVPQTSVPQTELLDDLDVSPTVQHQVKRLWRLVAGKLHPDRGGDPIIFRYAHALYKSWDLQALRDLSDCVEFGKPVLPIIRQKVQQLYEVAKCRPSYKLLCLWRKDPQKAKDWLLEILKKQ